MLSFSAVKTFSPHFTLYLLNSFCFYYKNHYICARLYEKRGDESPLSYFSDMSVETVNSKIEEWLQPVLNEKNLFLVEIRFVLGRKLEVYIDSDQGIHIDDCASISRFLEGHLDGSGLVPDNYILEVSSPGMDNPLKVPRQYKRRIGRILEVVKNDGTMFEAQLTEADNEKIKLL